MARTGKNGGGSGETLSGLEKRLGHHFADRDLLKHALMHSSAIADGMDEASNERFEFLGDRVLGLVIAEFLIRTRPGDDEGDLALRFNALVRKESCADVAERIDLGAHLVLGQSEKKTGGRNKTAILGDACEALIAALYLDGGLEAARLFIEKEWAPLLDGAVSFRQDAKTALQEWTQSKGNGIPHYNLLGRSGPDHAPAFLVEVSVAGVPPETGEAGSKRQAEQIAARNLLIRESIWSDDD